MTDADGTWTDAAKSYNSTALGASDKVAALVSRLSVYTKNHEVVSVEHKEADNWNKTNGNTLMKTLRALQ